MHNRLRAAFRRRPKTRSSRPTTRIALTLVLLIGVAGVNLLAYRHARSFMTFSESGAHTRAPETLGARDRFAVLLSGVTVHRPTNSQTPSDAGLEYDVHRYLTANGESLEAWYVPSPQDSEVLFVLFHGYAASKEDMLPVAAELHADGHSCFLVDFYGSGGSSGTGTTIGILEAEDVAASVDYVRVQWPGSKLVLYGQSMGGAAILRAVAVTGVEPDGVILEAVFDRMVSTVGNRFRTMGLPPTPFAQLLLFWGGVQVGENVFRHNPAGYARKVVCPALVLHGGLDPRVTPEQTRSLFSQLSGWKRRSEYDGVGHSAVVGSDPGRWSRDVESLVEAVRSGSRRSQHQ